ncbi:unnamed protein product [Ilex paraguariensis]|uniref:Uncharacterized protein n=1 Tax=Ilex paraguariensis TaxID=185542 RepID=A0ABC8TNX4_9AQUA
MAEIDPTYKPNQSNGPNLALKNLPPPQVQYLAHILSVTHILKVTPPAATELSITKDPTDIIDEALARSSYALCLSFSSSIYLCTRTQHTMHIAHTHTTHSE